MQSSVVWKSPGPQSVLLYKRYCSFYVALGSRLTQQIQGWYTGSTNQEIRPFTQGLYTARHLAMERASSMAGQSSRQTRPGALVSIAAIPLTFCLCWLVPASNARSWEQMLLPGCWRKLK